MVRTNRALVHAGRFVPVIAGSGPNGHDDPVTPTERLCLACGLCCSGALFDIVRLTPEESARLSAIGMPIVHGGNFDALLQPCAALDGRVCRVYAQRPARCAAYRCLLYEAVAADEVGLDEALGLIATAHTLEDEAREDHLDRHFRRPRRA